MPSTSEAVQLAIAEVIAIGISPTVVYRKDVTRQTWAKWYCHLNLWEWPPEWGEPPGWIKEKLSLTGWDRYNMQKLKYQQLCNAVMTVAGKKNVARHWHIERLGKTAEQFERWWEKEGKEINNLTNLHK